jgi:ankyrin repeat protein
MNQANQLIAFAARQGWLHELKQCLTPNNVDDSDQNGMTALHFAAENGHAECVKWCLVMRANVNAREMDGWTPLYMATSRGHADIVCLLLDAGAVVDATNNFGYTSLYRAIFDKHVHIIRLLIERGATASKVKLDDYVPAIPDWVTTIIAWRSNCRSAAVIIMGSHKYHRTSVTGHNDKNVMKLIGKHIWSIRKGDESDFNIK